MPRLILETTADLPENGQVPQILEALVEALSHHEGVASRTVKACHTLRSVWHMGEGAPPGFAHLTVAVLTGRTLEWRKHVAKTLYDVMREQFAESLAAQEVSVTLDLHEMNGDTYMR